MRLAGMARSSIEPKANRSRLALPVYDYEMAMEVFERDWDLCVRTHRAPKISQKKSARRIPIYWIRDTIPLNACNRLVDNRHSRAGIHYFACRSLERLERKRC